jgi:hypothetical protein
MKKYVSLKIVKKENNECVVDDESEILYDDNIIINSSIIIDIENTSIEDANENNNEINLNEKYLVVKKFINECIKTEVENDRIRFGISEIYDMFKKWNKTNKSLKGRNDFKQYFEECGFKIDKKKGISNDGDIDKRGYKIEFI